MRLYNTKGQAICMGRAKLNFSKTYNLFNGRWTLVQSYLTCRMDIPEIVLRDTLYSIHFNGTFINMWVR